MTECAADDIKIFSDTDEMPNPEFLRKMKKYDMNKQYC